MKERIRMVSGSLSVDARPGLGTRVVAKVALKGSAGRSGSRNHVGKFRIINLTVASARSRSGKTMRRIIRKIAANAFFDQA